MIAGIDEVGRGCLAGPVIAATVILKRPIKELRDSKKISPKKRKDLSEKIMENSIFAIGMANNQEIDRNQLAITMITTLHKTLDEYERYGMSGFVEKWNRLDNFINRPVTLLIGSKEITGIARGINEQGAVLLETENGLESYIGGEISLRFRQ